MRYASLAVIPALAVSLLCGCAKTGSINKPPGSSQAPDSARITVYRESALVGSTVVMTFTVNGREVYGLGEGGRYSFSLAPGDYGFGYFLGLNECRRLVHIEPDKDYLFKLAPNCVIEEE